ncbi:MAG: excinuclease ABC subunit UvrA, partial [Paraclostridium sp.]
MTEEYIELKGCRENNLKNVTLKIPKRKITIFTGVSGSGKSSIVFETVAKEAQRQLNETFSAFIRNFLPKYGDVKADYIGNLSTPIIIDQKRLGGNSRSTLGTITDINSFMRALYSRCGSTYIGKANMFSFNDVNGMCPECEGLGKKLTVDMDSILDKNKSLNEGAILLSGFGIGTWHWKLFTESGFFDNDKKICDYEKEELDKFLYGEAEKINIPDIGTMNLTYEGLIVKFNRLYLKKEGETSEAAKKKLSKLLTEGECPLCEGKRLNQQVYKCLINGYNIADLT